MIKTTKKISALRQITAALDHFEKKDYECVLTCTLSCSCFYGLYIEPVATSVVMPQWWMYGDSALNFGSVL